MNTTPIEKEHEHRANVQSQLSKNCQIGLVRKICAEHGVNKLAYVANAYETVRQLQIQHGTWGYESYTESGSDNVATMRSDATNSKKSCIVWSINHYLGLNRHPWVINAAVEATRTFGTGCGTSAMSGGHNQLHKQLEFRLARIMQKEASLLFPTGYSANVGAISGLAKIGHSAIIFDRECHASIIDGIKLSGAKIIPFKHNNVSDLRKKLIAATGVFENILVVVESVYSMSGEEAPLAEIAGLKADHDFLLFVDEAHAFGLYSVGGLCVELGLSEKVDFVMTTLSKSTASIGGVVATTREFVSLLQVEANAYAFQAAISPADAATVIASLDVIEDEPSVVSSLWEKTRYFRLKLQQSGFEIGAGSSPIVPLYVRNSEVLLEMGRDLQQNGIFTTAIAYPAVKHTEVRYRFIVNNSHTFCQIDDTVEVLKTLGSKYGLISSEQEHVGHDL